MIAAACLPTVAGDSWLTSTSSRFWVGSRCRKSPTGCLAETDRNVVVVAPIYGAREQPMVGVTADLVARGAARAGAATTAVRDRAAVTERPVSTIDFMATICTILGIDANRQNQASNGRPVRIVDRGATPIAGLV